MIQNGNILVRLPNEWYDCGYKSLTPFISWKAQWPSLSEPIYNNLKKFNQSFFKKEISEKKENLLIATAISLSTHLFTGKNFTIKEWISEINIPDNSNRFIYPFIDELSAIEAGKKAHLILYTLLQHTDCNIEIFMNHANKLIIDAEKQLAGILLSDASARILREAAKRNIPFTRYSGIIPLYQLGNGKKLKLFWRSFTSETSHSGTIVSTHKQISNEILSKFGFPVPRQHLVMNFEMAKAAANDIGYPIVVKPSNTDYGTGVSTNVMDEATLYHSFMVAKSYGNNIIIEKSIEGEDYRLTVINGKCSSIVKRIPAHIIGNGIDTVKSLVSKMVEEREADSFYRNFKSITLEDPQVVGMLRKNNLRPDSIPEKGKAVFLRSNANVSTGGTMLNVTTSAHPDNKRLAERVASCIGLDVAGIDFITTDISKSWKEAGGGICEVNPTPMIVPGIENQFIDYLFPEKSDIRIPLIAIVGETADTSPLRDILLSYTKSRNIIAGSVSANGATINQENITCQHASISAMLTMVLADRSTEVAVVEISPLSLKENGLDTSYCSLAIFISDDEVTENLIASPLSVLKNADFRLIRPDAEKIISYFEKLQSN